MNKLQKLAALQDITALKFQKESAAFSQLQAQDNQLKQKFDALEHQKSTHALQPQASLNMQAREMVVANWLRWIEMQQRAINAERIDVRMKLDRQKARLNRAHGEKSVSGTLKEQHVLLARTKRTSGI